MKSYIINIINIITNIITNVIININITINIDITNYIVFLKYTSSS